MLKLQAVELNKSYRGRKVVDGVELEIGQGEATIGCPAPNRMGSRLAKGFTPPAQARWVAQLHVRVP